MKRCVTRREILRTCGAAVLAYPLSGFLGCGSQSSGNLGGGGGGYNGTDDQLMDDIERAAFDFFWTETDPNTGQIKDRALAAGNDARRIASIASTGFGLAGLAIADQRGYGKSADITARVRQTLQFVYNQLPNEHGFFYHFVDMSSGARQWNCEVSSVDTAILMCGILTARQHFSDPDIQSLATSIYQRVDWAWMLNGGATLSMGWTPESGFLDARWEHYCELMVIYLLAIGSPTYPIPASSWDAWTRPTINYQGIQYISGNDPLFTHQFSHAFYDFRKQSDAYANYFDNSVKTTQAHKLFCLSLANRFSDYQDNFWGITASDSAAGYQAWGGPPLLGNPDGSVVPCATAGSLPFVYADCIKVLRNLRSNYAKAWARYGFVDAFNPLTSWYDTDVIGIDLGISMLMAENYRTGFVWQTFMKNPEAQAAMKQVGFHATADRKS